MSKALKNSRFFSTLAACTLAVAAISTCKSRTDLSQQKDSIPRYEPAWFVDGTKAIKICLNFSNKVMPANLSAQDKSTKFSLYENMVISAYADWMAYIWSKGLQPAYYMQEARAVADLPRFSPLSGNEMTWIELFDPTVNGIEDDFNCPDFLGIPKPRSTLTTYPHESNQISRINLTQSDINRLKTTNLDYAKFFPAALETVDDCGNADLEVHFGTKPSWFHQEVVFESETTVAAIIPDPASKNLSWQRGAILLRDVSDDLTYRDPSEVSLILTHEFGHILGTPHVPGTIMDPQELTIYHKTLRDLTKLLPGPNPNEGNVDFSPSIDRWRQLLLPNNSFCKDGSSFNVVRSWLGFDINSGRFVYATEGDSSGTTTLTKTFEGTETEVNTPLFQVFRKPDVLGESKLFHESKIWNRWYNRNALMKISMNTNKPHTSPLQVLGDCKGHQADIFAGQFTNLGYLTTPYQWTPIDVHPVHIADDYVTCLEGKPVKNQRFETSNQWSEIQIQDRLSQMLASTFLRESPETASTSKYCTNIAIPAMTLCIACEEVTCVLKLKSASQQVALPLLPYVNDLLPDDHHLAQGWFSGSGNWQKQENMKRFRIGVNKVITPSESSYQYELDFSENQNTEFWRRGSRGTLKKIN